MISKEKEKIVIEKVEQRLLERYRQHSLVEEVDFLVGAATVMSVLTCPEGKDVDDWMWPDMPPMWIFFPMGNRSVVAELLKDNGQEKKAQDAQYEDDRALMLRRYSEDMLGLLHSFSKLRYYDLNPYETCEHIERECISLLSEMGEIEEE